MSTASLIHIALPGTLIAVLVVLAIYLSHITYSNGLNRGRKEAAEPRTKLIRDLQHTIDKHQNHVGNLLAANQRIKREAKLAMYQLEARHQRQRDAYEIAEQMREERERTALTVDREQAAELIQLLRLASPMLHSNQQYNAAQSAEAIRAELQKQLLSLRLVEHENATAAEGTH